MRAPPFTRLLALVCAFGAVTLPQGRATARRVAREPGPTLDVQPMGGLARAATDAMRARMREHVARHLRALVDAHLLTSPRGYLVDGSIDTLEVVVKADTVELSGSVRLILSARQSGAMLMMTTGQATLSNTRRALKPTTEARLELEVLDGAVRAACDELIEHFQARRKT